MKHRLLFAVRIVTCLVITGGWAVSTLALAQAQSPVNSDEVTDPGVSRSNGQARRFSLAVTYNSDTSAVVSGGRPNGAAYLQRIGLIGDLDLGPFLGRDAAAHFSIHSIAGTGLSARRIGNLLTVSGLEAAPALRLFNFWVEQRLSNGASIRVGQFSAGQEFAMSSTADFFVNSSFGWPGSFAANLPGGGPAYPVAVPGVRVSAASRDAKLTVRAGMFAANPSGRDRRGLSGWRFKGRPFGIAEIVSGSGQADPAWTLTAGGWASLERFSDLPVTTGRELSGNVAIYAIADARLLTEGSRSVHVFIRSTLSPSNRNVVARYLDAGLTMIGPLRSRPRDVVGIAIAVAAASRGGSRSTAGTLTPEIAIETSYQVRLGKAVYLQPNIQLILNPFRNIGAAASSDMSDPRRTALALGVRSSLRL